MKKTLLVFVFIGLNIASYSQTNISYSEDEISLIDAVIEIGLNRNMDFLVFDDNAKAFKNWNGLLFIENNNGNIFLLNCIDRTDDSLEDYISKSKYTNIIIPVDHNLFGKTIDTIIYNIWHSNVREIYDDLGANEILSIRSISIDRTNNIGSVWLVSKSRLDLGGVFLMRFEFNKNDQNWSLNNIWVRTPL